VQNTVDAREYGLYFTLFNFAFLFQIINDFGLQNFNNRHLAQHEHLLAKYFPSFLSLKFLLAVLYLLVVFMAGKLANYPDAYFHLLSIIGVNWILMSLVLYLRSNVSGLGWYRTDSLLSVLDRSLMILVCGFLLWAPGWKGTFRMEWFVYAQTFTLSTTALVAFWVISREMKHWKFRLRPVYLLLILKKSYPYALVIFLMTVYTRIDGVMIERLLPDGARQAGIYAMAYRLLDAANMFGFLVAGLLLPMFARILRDRQAVFSLLNLSFRIVWVVSIGLALSVFFFREPIMEGLYVEGDVYSSNILGYLILSFIAVSGTYIHGTLLTANGSMLKMNLVFVVGVILNVLLNGWLIPEMQALGAALATCITQFVVWLAQVELVRRTFARPVQWVLLFRLIFFGLACLLIFQWLADQSGRWLFRFLLCFPLTALLSFAFGLVTKRQIRELLSGRSNFTA
jgi:O-antigen/teichoic acid export membrane protein